MSIRVQTVGATQLQPATAVPKRNFTTSATIGGAASQVVGAYRGAFVKLPSSMTGNQLIILFGGDPDRDGIINEALNSGTVIGQATSGTGPYRPRFRHNTLNVGSDNMTQMANSGTYLVLSGTTNRGTNGSPAWIEWMAYCDVATGTVHSWTQAHNSTFTSSTTFNVLDFIFLAASAVSGRTTVGFELEHVAWVDGDFPWDTANDGSTTGSVAGQGRPHHDAIRSLCGYGTDPFLDFAEMAAAQNDGTLPYANLRGNGDTPSRPGRADVSYWWKLPNLTTLDNAGTGGTNALSEVDYNSLSDGLTNGSAPLAPSHWAPETPLVTEPYDKFIPGRGARAYTFSGTYPTGTTAVERRWVLTGTSTPVSGRDWADVTTLPSGTFSGNNWSFSESMPVGYYDLQVRDVNTPALSVTSTEWMSGARVVMHGQSGMALSIRSTGINGANNTNTAAVSGCLGQVVRLNNMYADTANGSTPTGVYVQPQPTVTRIIGGTTPAVGQGAVAAINAWHAINPGEPLQLMNMAINTYGMDEWTSNIANAVSHPTWKFLGPLTLAAPGVSDGSASGVVNYYAFLANGYTDLHMIMWTPGMSSTTGAAGDLLGSGTGRVGYYSAIDARFANSATAPWLIYPVWRVSGPLSGSDTGINVRNRHMLFADELGATRGIVGPCWPDTVADGDSSGHAANLGAAGGFGVTDANAVGQGKIGAGFGRSIAWSFNRKVKAHGPRILGAWWRDAGVRTIIEIELGRQMRTLNSAAILPDQFFVSTDSGNTFVNTGFTVALSTDGTRAVLTTTGGAFPAGTRVDALWSHVWSVPPNAESGAEAGLPGLLYDNQIYRGNTNLATIAGNAVEGVNRQGVGVAGVLVATKAATAKLLTTERFTGTRNVTVRMMASDGVTVLKEKAVTITAS